MIQSVGRNTSDLSVRNILDTSYLTYQQAGFRELFSTQNGDYIVPGRLVPEFVKRNLEHLNKITDAVNRDQLFILSSVLSEIEARKEVLESYRQALPRHSLRRTCMEIYHQAFSEFNDLIHTRTHLDPQQSFNLEDSYLYNDIFRTVKQTSGDIYHQVKYGRCHSAQSQRWETDLHIAAMTFFFARRVDVNIFTNDHDIKQACKSAASGLIEDPYLTPRYHVNVFSVPYINRPPRVARLFFDQPVPALQKNVA